LENTLANGADEELDSAWLCAVFAGIEHM